MTTATRAWVSAGSTPAAGWTTSSGTAASRSRSTSRSRGTMAAKAVITTADASRGADVAGIGSQVRLSCTRCCPARLVSPTRPSMPRLPALLLLVLLSPAVCPADDWPQWRGPQRDGHARGARLPAAWPEKPPRPLWKRAVGAGQSSPVVAGGRLFVLGRQGGREA